MINELCKKAHENAKEKGFFDSPKNIGEMLCLMHSEISEALEADRNRMYSKLSQSDKNVLEGWVQDEEFKNHYELKVKGTFDEEMADICIRVFDMCAFKNIDLEFHIKMKMRYNSLRKRKHGKEY